VREFLERSKRSVVVELNATEQFEGLIRQHCMRDVSHHLNRYDGRPISPEQVYQFINLMLHRPVELTAAGAVVPTEGAR
jgi:pyruvate/2-oxoacid:ferredoxin oxidoreductase alpha subunit